MRLWRAIIIGKILLLGFSLATVPLLLSVHANADPAFRLPYCGATTDEIPPLDFGTSATITNSALHCTSRHLIANSKYKADLFKALTAKIPPNSHLTSITISSYIFDGPFLSSAICQLPGVGKAKVRILTQSDPQDTTYGVNPTIQAISACAESVEVFFIGCNLFTPRDLDSTNTSITTLCGSNQYKSTFGIVSYHAKFISLFLEDSLSRAPYIVLAVGSGNQTANSLYVNIEDWYVTRLMDSIAQASWLCAEKYFLALTQSYVADAARGLSECRKAANIESLTDSVPSFLVMPADLAILKTTLRNDLRNAKRVRIASQFFEWRWLKLELSSLVDTRKELFLESSYPVAALTRQTRNFVTPDMADAFIEWSNGVTDMTVRYLQTNHFFCELGFANTLHARSIDVALADDSHRYFLLSAHMRDGSFERNAELVTLLGGKDAWEQAEFFNRLSDRSIGEYDVAGRVYKDEECTNG
jgi:hypothetical protein